MPRAKTRKMPDFDSLDELVDFFETHDLGDYLDEMPEAQFDVDIKKRTHLFMLDDAIAEKITVIAKSKHISSESLIDSWLKEKIQEQTHG